MQVSIRSWPISDFFFFNDTATTEIYTLSLHDALPISARAGWSRSAPPSATARWRRPVPRKSSTHCSRPRSEEHTSELQSQSNLVCRLLLEKKKKPILPTMPHSAEQLFLPESILHPSVR